MVKRRNPVTKRILIVVGLVLALLIGVFFYGWNQLYNEYIYPERRPIDETPADYGLDYQEQSLTTTDGLTLACWLITPPADLQQEKMPTLIVLHGYNTNRSDILPRIDALARAGFQIFTYDHRACGQSEGKKITMTLMEAEDLEKTVFPHVASLPSVDKGRMAIYGFSMGGVLAITGGARIESLQAVVADSPYASLEKITAAFLHRKGIPHWPYSQMFPPALSSEFERDISRNDAVNAVAGISPRPLLLIHGNADTTVPVEHAELIFAAAGKPKHLKIFPGHDHDDNGSSEIINSLIVPFLRDALKIETSPELSAEAEESAGEPVD